MKSIVMAVFGLEAQLTLFLRPKKLPKHSENVFRNTSYSRYIGITNANDEIRFLTEGQICKQSKVFP